MMQLFRFVFAIAALLCFAAPSFAQRVLIETSTLASAREAASIYVHSAMFSGAPELGPVLLPGPVRLPGGEQQVLPHISADETLVFASSVLQQPGAPHIVSAIRTAPFEAVPRWDHIVDAGWRVDAVTTLVAAGIGQRYLVIAESQGGRSDEPRLRVVALDRARALHETPHAVHALPGRAAALAPMADWGRVAVLCEPGAAGLAAGAPAVLHVRDIFGQETVVDAAPLPGDAQGLFHARPVSVVLSPEGSHLLALVTGDSLREGDTGPVSWLYALNALDGSPAAPALEMPGTAHSESLRPIAAGLVDADAHAASWVVTHSPRLRFGHLVRAVLRDGGWRLDVQQPLGGAVQPPRIAVSDLLPRAAIVAVGNRVELWPDGMISGVSHAVDEPVSALDAHAGRVFVGGGSRVQALALPTLTPHHQLSLPDEIVQGVHIVPRAGPVDDVDGDGLGLREEQARGTQPTNPDTDGDGIHDGIDPTPLDPGPQLDVPRLIVLQSEGIGAEVHAVPIYAEVDDDALRIVSVDAESAPWLVVSPRSWRGPGAFYLGVDRAWYGSFQEPADTRLTVRLLDPRTNRDAYGSPAEIAVRVLPPRSSVRRILWLVDGVASPAELRAGRGPGFRELSQLLASPPHFFSHAVERAVLDDLSPYAVIVADGAAAARGAILRQAMLDYVAQGGALLFVAGALEGEAARTASRWLQPAGIRVAPGRAVVGAFESDGDHPLSEAWESFAIERGALLDVVAPARALVPVEGNPPGAALAVARYGRGRIAVLSGGDPIADDQMLRAGNRRFAERLFAWLTGAGLDEPGEPWDALLVHDPDSPADAPPVIAAVEPGEGPAEGGTPVLIHGRGFAPGATVYFGAQPALSPRYIGPTSLRVDTPPAAEGGDGFVPVRVSNPGTAIDGIRTDAFRYGPRSVVRLSLRALGAASGIYHDTIALAMDEASVGVGLIAVRLHADAPRGSVQWGSARPGGSARAEERVVTSVVDPNGDLFVTVGQPRSGRPAAGGDLALIPVQIGAGVTEPIEISINWERALAPHGEPLDTTLEGAVLAPP